MTITTIAGINFVELSGSRETTRSVDAKSIPLRYMAWWTNDRTALETAFALLVGVTFAGLPLDTTHLAPRGGGVWECEALFSLRIPVDSANQDDTEALGIAYAVDLTAGQIHITQSLETISTKSAGSNGTTDATPENFYPGQAVSTNDVNGTVTIIGPDPPWNPGDYTITDVPVDSNGNLLGYWLLSGAAAGPNAKGGIWSATVGPDYKQAIGVTKDSVTGTDIFTPKFEFSVTVKTYPVTLDFLRTLNDATGKTNNALWKGFSAGSVLYLGCTGQANPDDFWTLTHKFAVGQNRTGLVVSPQITVDKKGWEYLWCGYQFGGSAGGVVQRPNLAKVERVYESTDFNLLRLNPPIADFTSDVIGGLHPLLVNFVDLSTGTPLTWLWTFGDGTFSALRNPSKIYVLPGVYTVSLTVTNGAGSSFKTVVNYITVS